MNDLMQAAVNTRNAERIKTLVDWEARRDLGSSNDGRLLEIKKVEKARLASKSFWGSILSKLEQLRP